MFLSSYCLQTCEHSRGVSALILPNKVAHVTRGMAGSEQAPHVDGVKLQKWRKHSIKGKYGNDTRKAVSMYN